MTIFNKALKLLNDGYPDLAWELAKKDESLNDNVTKEQWCSYAANVLLIRKDALLASNNINYD